MGMWIKLDNRIEITFESGTFWTNEHNVSIKLVSFSSLFHALLHTSLLNGNITLLKWLETLICFSKSHGSLVNVIVCVFFGGGEIGVGRHSQSVQRICNFRETYWLWFDAVRGNKINTLNQEVYEGMVRFNCHVEVRSKHILGIKSKDKAIVGSGSSVRPALTREIRTKVVWEKSTAPIGIESNR